MSKGAHAVYVILERMLIQTVSAMCLVAVLGRPPALSRVEGQPQTYQAPKARRHFISVTIDKQSVQPYSFGKHPLSDLLGQPVDEVHFESFQYRTHDQKTSVTVL